MFQFRPFCPTSLLNWIAAAIIGMLITPLGAEASDIYQTVAAGSKVTLTATAEGSPAPTFQWTKNGVAIPSATSATLIFASITTADNGVYNAIATNAAGWALSSDLILTVGTTTPPPNSAPTFTVQPYPSATAPVGSSITLGATAVGSPAPSYQWLKNSTVIPSATNSTLSFTSLTTADSGTYSVVAKNIVGSVTSNNSVLTVTSNSAPIFTVQPNPSVTAPAGSSTTLTATATGSPTPSYQWLKNGAAISGATNSTLTFTSLSTADAGTYSVIAKNIVGTATSNNSVLSVTSNSAPIFTVQPNPSVTAPAGSSITLTATATGSPTPSYQWLKNGAAISGATNSTLSFTALSTADAGTYSVIAKNIVGTATSNNSILTVTSAPANSAPVFFVQPISQAVARKSSVTFKVAASGTPAPSYQWYRNGMAISGATDVAYTITSVSTSHAGTYTAVAKNIAGSVTSQGAVLTVSR